MKGWLLFLYPKSWLNQYGEEYVALLEDTGLSLSTTVDIIKTALILQLNSLKKRLTSTFSTTSVTARLLMDLRLGIVVITLLLTLLSPTHALGLITTIALLLYISHKWPIPPRELTHIQHKRWTKVLTVTMLNLVSTIILMWLCVGLALNVGIGRYIIGNQLSLHIAGLDLSSLARISLNVISLFIGIIIIRAIANLQTNLLKLHKT